MRASEVAVMFIRAPFYVIKQIVTASYKAGTDLWRQHKDAVAKRQNASSDQDFNVIRDQLRKYSICGQPFTDVESDSSTEDGCH